MNDMSTAIQIFLNDDHTGTLAISEEDAQTPIWSRIKLSIRSKGMDCIDTGNRIKLSWPNTLGLVRGFGSRATQRSLNFRFRPEGKAAEELKKFASQVKATQEQRKSLSSTITEQEIEDSLVEAGFTKRRLKPFQLRDLRHLFSLSNGANFSVPGAGKTTVTFALHLLTRHAGQHLIVVAPKAATQVWLDIVSECMTEDAPDNRSEQFTLLDGSELHNRQKLLSGATRFIISYDLLIRQQGLITSHIVSTPTHLVLDESHRMKAGWQSQRGAFLLSISALPVRRDILTGTPMPQSASDIESQLDFLWPGHGLGLEVIHGKSPKTVLGNLYVRTTKKELDLPKANHKFVDVLMSEGQLALYSIVRNEFVRNYYNNLSQRMAKGEFLKARRSVMRLLQLSVNPVLALTAMANDDISINSAVIEQVMDEVYSKKMNAVMNRARVLANAGEKCVIWTIFTDTIYNFASSLADLNPVFIHGGVPSGSTNEIETREGRLKRFHEDDNCYVLVANPAATGEGISLHTVCHNALYADRSYVSTHYLQSIDRIHRLGLPPNQETNIFVYRSKAPPRVGSIDYSVSRRLVEKIRNMQQLLDDPDLHQLALDEESADDPIDYDIELQDIMDLIAEMENRAGDVPMEEA